MVGVLVIVLVGVLVGVRVLVRVLVEVGVGVAQSDIGSVPRSPPHVTALRVNFTLVLEDEAPVPLKVQSPPTQVMLPPVFPGQLLFVQRRICMMSPGCKPVIVTEACQVPSGL